ncbi:MULTISPECIES: acyl-homoserine-lactone synthase [unclassified Bradyrhizobium]|uniref:acyl-homoserine-lactone synthase n=1 Tax=unclassified Bradyrhizobium TaxID=2631580 RepID=UPI0028EE7864|nr:MULTISPECIES: acyl-homoserine-lactone synthase [unclassified Bradyrhizobium]
MPEIHVVRKDNRHLYESYFDPYFRLRHDIYVKQRKWMALDRPDGREIDQFDTEDSVYLFCLDQGQLIGAMRAVPTLLPTLMSEIFPYLNIRGPIHRPDIYELSRIFVIPERRGEHAGPRIDMLLLTAIMEYGISIGLSGFSIVLESWWLPRFERCGWKARPLGLPRMIDGMSVLAVLVDCDEATWKSLCQQIGLNRPTLTWQGLDDLSRQALPDIFLPLPPAIQPSR